MENDRDEVFKYIANCGMMLKVSTIWVNSRGFVDHKHIVIHEAPPKAVREIVGSFKLVSLTADGLIIPVASKE